MPRRTSAPRRDPLRALPGAIMLAGLAIFLLVDEVSFWPWILVVLALAAAPGAIQRAGPVGLLPAAWLIALAVLIAAGAGWPGVLALLGLTVLLAFVIRAVRRR